MSMVAAFLGEGHKGRRPATSSSSPMKDPMMMRSSPTLTLEPAIDGPPSPQRIRAYTEQMKKSVAAASHSRSNTSTSTSSSFGSADSRRSKSPEPSLSRQNSKKSSGGMSERPDSIQIFGKSLFSRGSKKSKTGAGRMRASSSLSLNPRDSHLMGSRGAVDEEQSFKKHLISGPYNFQHVVHTGLQQMPNVDIASREDLLEEFSTVRRSHGPSGELKGIMADDLHFQNFSSEAVDTMAEPGTDYKSRKSPNRPRNTMRKPPSPIQQRPQLRSTKSHDNVGTRQAPPPRPPRSPMMMTQPCPITLPPRTSSKTASMIWDEYDPMGAASVERPHYPSGFRRPQAFHLPLSPPLPSAVHDEQADYFQQEITAPPRTPENEGWPFASSQTAPSENQLADVPEEEENIAARRNSRISSVSIDLRSSKSTPNLLSFRRSDSRNEIGRPHTPTTADAYPDDLVMTIRSPVKLSLDAGESWEDDIDYCYDHEVEADCDYNWERHSMETEVGHDTFHDSAISTNDGEAIMPKNSYPPITLHSASASISRRLSQQIDSLRDLPNNLTAPPSATSTAIQTPELGTPSDVTADSPTSLRSPNHIKKPTMHLRSPSYASSFKESHGFNLSPSLLIPVDYAKQMQIESHSPHRMDADGFTYEHTDFLPLQSHEFDHLDAYRVSAPESTASYRSSTTSRTDGGLRESGSSSTSLAASNPAYHGGHAQCLEPQLGGLLERAAEVALAHRSISSNGSVPDLIASARSMPSSNPFSTYIEPACAAAAADAVTSSPRAEWNPAPSPTQWQRVADEEQSAELALQISEERLLPPSPAPCALRPSMQAQMAHGRKGSVPLLAGRFALPRLETTPPRVKGRARASTLGARGSYMLFPPVLSPTV